MARERVPVIVLVAVLGMIAAPAAGATGVQAAQWSYAGIGQSERTVRIIAGRGACSTLPPPLVEETPAFVRITQPVRDDPLPPGVICNASLVLRPVYVSLAAPLAGRKLLGAAPRAFLPFPSGAVPRVVGLSARDAITVLRGAFVKPVVVRRVGGPGLRRIVSQNGVRLVVGGSVSP